MNLLDKFKQGLSKTRQQVFGQIQNAVFTARKIDDELLEEIEDLLISGDVGVDTTMEIIERLQRRLKTSKLENSEQFYELLKEEIADLVAVPHLEDQPLSVKPEVILVVGVNGTGKTTSIAKLARLYQKQGKRVLLVAADTFRAAAIEQLQEWADRIDAGVIKHRPGADPGAVAFDAVTAGRSRGSDVIIIDTAGRLHTKVNLMEELRKIRRVIQKVIPEAPHQTLLVLDATIGQNAISQAKQFIESVAVNGIILAKLDGTAKGGAVIGISHKLGIPVKYIGLGEKIDDLQPFDPGTFVEGLFS